MICIYFDYKYLNYKMNTQNNNQNKAENTENTEETRFKKMKKPEMIKLIKSLEKSVTDEEGFSADAEMETEKLTEENKKLSEEIQLLRERQGEWLKEQDNYKSNQKHFEEEIELLKNIDNDEKYNIMITEKNAEIHRLKSNDDYEELQQTKRNLEATEVMLENVNEELQREKDNRKTDRLLWCKKINECDDLMEELEKAKEKTVRKKKEPVIEYLETKEFYLDGTFDTPTQKGYMPIDAESYINHMKIKDVKEIIEITLSYNQEQSPHLMELSTETQEDERWIIKKTVRTATRKTEEEIKKQEENIDFNTNCQSCIYNGKGYSMRPCKKAGTLMRGTHRICKLHNKNADTHLAKYVGFTVEMGTHLGWYGEEETYHQEKGREIKPDYVKPSRK